MYDLRTETTITGTIESVETLTRLGNRPRRGLGGTHFMVKTDLETIEVHAGPTTYLDAQKIIVAKGDAVDTLGSRVTINGQPVLIARQIKKGAVTWTLRDESGRPLWGGRGW